MTTTAILSANNRLPVCACLCLCAIVVSSHCALFTAITVCVCACETCLLCTFSYCCCSLTWCALSQHAYDHSTPLYTLSLSLFRSQRALCMLRSFTGSLTRFLLRCALSAQERQAARVRDAGARGERVCWACVPCMRIVSVWESERERDSERQWERDQWESDRTGPGPRTARRAMDF